MKTEIQIEFNDKTHTLVRGDDGLYSLTDLWRISGTDEDRKPTQWLRWQPAKDFIDSLAEKSKLCKSAICKSRRGRHFGGVWAHWQIALAYAQWLSPEFHQVVNEIFLRYQEEAKDPELGFERLIAAWENKGKDPVWIDARLQGLLVRRGLTSELVEHGCTKSWKTNAEATISDIGNLAVLGKTAKEFLDSRGLPKHARTRDHLAVHELTAISFFEAYTAKHIRDVDARGNASCEVAAFDVANTVSQAMMSLNNMARPIAVTPSAPPAPVIPTATAAPVDAGLLVAIEDVLHDAAGSSREEADSPIEETTPAHRPRIEERPARSPVSGVLDYVRSAFRG